MKRNISVLSAIPNLFIELRASLPKENFIEVKEKNILENLNKSEIIIADCDLISPHLNQLTSNVKWVQLTWAGIEKLFKNLQSTKSLPFIINRFSDDSFKKLMAEYVVSEIVNYERKRFVFYSNQKNKIWLSNETKLLHRMISDLKVGILGIGTIGNFVAETLNHFGAEVYGLSRSSKNINDYKHLKNIYLTNELSNLLEKVDYFVNILPSTKETFGLLNNGMLKNCQGKSSVFINVGRGNIITENELVKALNEKWIQAAILDVFETEPLPEFSQLWNMNQVFITPHIAAISRPQDIANFFAKNLKNYDNNEKIPNIINLENMY